MSRKVKEKRFASIEDCIDASIQGLKRAKKYQSQQPITVMTT